VSGLAQAAHRLHPPERFFDAFALDRADAIAGMASRARIDRRPAVGVVLRDVRRAAAFATASDEVSRIIVLVATHGASGFGVVLDHVERGRALGRAVSLRQPGIDDKPIATAPSPAMRSFFSGRRREEIDLTKVRSTQANSGL
jgi:hypothetical protein